MLFSGLPTEEIQKDGDANGVRPVTLEIQQKAVSHADAKQLVPLTIFVMARVANVSASRIMQAINVTNAV